MADPNSLPLHEYADHVEAVGIALAAVSGNPHSRRTAEVALLPPTDGLDRVAKSLSGPCLDFDERDEAVPLDYKVNVTVSVPEAPLQQPPSLTT